MPYRHHSRPWAERAGDEVRSWFGDRGAETRREHDEREHEDPSWYEWREDVPSRDRGAIWRDRPWSPAGDWPMTGPHLGKGPRNYQRGDDRIREDLCEELTAAGDIDAREIDVEVVDGEVTLSGHVDSRAAKREAEDLAYRIPGVREVYNRLRVVPTDQFNATDSDIVGPHIWK